PQSLPSSPTRRSSDLPGGILGIAFNLDEASIGCIVLGEAETIEEGQPVKQTGRILSAGVGDGVLGRVIDPVGNPVDGKGPIQYEDRKSTRLNSSHQII